MAGCLHVIKWIEGSNMKIKSVVLALFLFFAGGSAYSSVKYYLPQVAIGSFGTGSFRTTFVCFNNQNIATNVTLSLANDDGSPMSVTIPGQGTNSTFSFTLGAGATRILQTDNSGNARAGAATVTSDISIGVSGLFTIYDAQGNFVTEAGVGNSNPLTNFVIPVQVIGNYNTGLALFNPNTTDSSITATLKDTDGTVSGTTAFTLPAGKHMGKYVGGDLFLNISNFQGTLTIQSSIAISAMTLRQNSPPLSYTSTPVVPVSSTQKTFNLAQVVNGADSGIGYKTTFMLFNMSSSTASAGITLTKDDGTPLSVTIAGQGTKSTFNLSIGAGKSLFLQTDGTGPLSQGAAVITSDVPIGAAGIFTQYDSHGNFATEAGVQDSPALKTFTLPIDSAAGATDTGIALFNPGSSSVTITPRFLDAGGISTPATAPIVLLPNGHYANFFGSIFPGLGSVQGSLAISAATAISALTMRENLSPFSMTSLPVVEGISTGTTYPTTGSVLPQTQSAVNASANVTVNKTLPFGFKLSGAVSGDGFPSSVEARSGSSVYAGTTSISFTTGGWSYSIIVPPGTYDIYAFSANAANDSSATTVGYHIPNSITVSKDTTLDITLPTPTLFTVSGTVSGPSSALSLMASASSVSLQFSSADGLSSGYCSVTNGAYQMPVPAGNYSISLFASVAHESIGLNMGTLNVSANTTDNLTMGDFATLSGTASFPGAYPASATIFAFDPSDAEFDGGALLIDSGFNGSYSMKLVKNRTYMMGISWPIADAGITVGNVQFPVATSSISFAGDSTYNFTLPALPTLVTISGKIVDSNNKAIAKGTVSATSSSLTGTPNTAYSASGVTDSTGAYSIKVLKGTNYQLAFTPPAPSSIIIPTF
jgi:hypothetical protein